MTGHTSALIEAVGITRRFAVNGGKRLSFGPFSIPRGKTVALIGPSGVGKTTLLNILAGIDPTDEFNTGGKALFRPAEEGDTYDLSDWDTYPRPLVSSVFQRGYLLGNVSIGMNIAVPMELAGREPSDDKLKRSLERVGFRPDEVEGLVHRKPWQISGGQAQRVGIARALARDPSVLFADEPTSNLDEGARDDVLDVLTEWRNAKPDRTLILVSHDLDLVARNADEVILMHRDTSVTGQHDGDLKIALTYCEPGLGEDALRALIIAAADGSEGAATPRVPISDSDQRPQARGKPHIGKVARKLALSELLSRRRRVSGGASFQNATSSWEGGGGFFAILRHLSFFGNWSSVAISFLSITVAFAMLVAFFANVERLAYVNSNPQNCGLVVTGIRGGDAPDLDADTQKALALRPWNSEMSDAQRAPALVEAENLRRATCQSGPAAFARQDVTQVFMSIPRTDGSCEGHQINISLLATEQNDPILGRSTIVTDTKLTTGMVGRSLEEFFRNPVFQSRGVVFLSRELLLRMTQERLPGPEKGVICLHRGPNVETFPLGGIVDELPSPRIRGFEAFIPAATYSSFAYNRPPRTVPQFQLYYDPGGMFRSGASDALQDFVTGRFGFVEDDLVKSRRLRSEARASVLALGVLVLLNAALFFVVTYTSTLGYLRTNAQQIAVLRTFDLRFRAAVLQNFLTLGYSVGLALIPLSILLAGLGFITPIAFGEGVEITFVETVAGLLVILCASVVISFLSTWWATRAWWKSDRLLSEIIG